MAKKKNQKKASSGAPNPFKPVLIGLFLIAILVTTVTVFGNLFDSKGKIGLTRTSSFTYQEVADTVRDLRVRQRELWFGSPFAPGIRPAPEVNRIL